MIVLSRNQLERSCTLTRRRSITVAALGAATLIALPTHPIAVSRMAGGMSPVTKDEADRLERFAAECERQKGRIQI
jgi:hypothetical protein